MSIGSSFLHFSHIVDFYEIEVKPNQRIKYQETVKLQCKEIFINYPQKCSECYFGNNLSLCVKTKCTPSKRNDKKDVIFVEY